MKGYKSKDIQLLCEGNFTLCSWTVRAEQQTSYKFSLTNIYKG